MTVTASEGGAESAAGIADGLPVDFQLMLVVGVVADMVWFAAAAGVAAGIFVAFAAYLRQRSK